MFVYNTVKQSENTLVEQNSIAVLGQSNSLTSMLMTDLKFKNYGEWFN